MGLQPSGRLGTRTVPKLVLDATRTGQTRYRELLDDLDVTEPELDRALMYLAKDGDVSLIAVGDALTVQSQRR